MSAKTLIRMIAACSLGGLALCAVSSEAIAEKTSPETQSLRDALTPSEPPSFGTGSATDLEPLNPDPELLDLPQDESDVEIDLTQPISLEDALILARRNNRDIQVSELDVKQAEARLDQAKSDRFRAMSLNNVYKTSQYKHKTL